MKSAQGGIRQFSSKLYTPLVVAVALMVTCPGCVVSKDMAAVFSHPEEAYKLYPGPVLADAQLATLVAGDAVGVILVDGLMFSKREYASAKLLPGEYQLSWGAWFGVSVLVDPSGYGEANIATTARLNAGRTYVARFDRTTGPGYQTYLWLEDIDSGEVIAGVRKP